MYLIAALATEWTRRTLHTHIGPALFDGTYGAMLEWLWVLSIFWLICLWLYQQRIFIRV